MMVVLDVGIYSFLFHNWRQNCTIIAYWIFLLFSVVLVAEAELCLPPLLRPLPFTMVDLDDKDVKGEK
jgi:hypothetical protein